MCGFIRLRRRRYELFDGGRRLESSWSAIICLSKMSCPTNISGFIIPVVVNPQLLFAPRLRSAESTILSDPQSHRHNPPDLSTRSFGIETPNHKKASKPSVGQIDKIMWHRLKRSIVQRTRLYNYF